MVTVLNQIPMTLHDKIYSEVRLGLTQNIDIGVSNKCDETHWGVMYGPQLLKLLASFLYVPFLLLSCTV